MAIAEVVEGVDKPSAQLVAFGAPAAVDTMVANRPPDFADTEADGTSGETGRRGGGGADNVHGIDPSGSKRIVHPGNLIEKGCTTGACIPTPVAAAPEAGPVEGAVAIGSEKGVETGAVAGGTTDMLSAAAGVGGGGPAGALTGAIGLGGSGPAGFEYVPGGGGGPRRRRPPAAAPGGPHVPSSDEEESRGLEEPLDSGPGRLERDRLRGEVVLFGAGSGAKRPVRSNPEPGVETFALALDCRGLLGGMAQQVRPHSDDSQYLDTPWNLAAVQCTHAQDWHTRRL